ncbi:DUF3304 domain-containing protein [Janthinobacterium sp. YR213]|uniref:DUF3304 domain-containing protein n=1 Tax=Janthinobacterium sp. YR213 TaxID=1881027 RepID=UPI000884EADF|nr:DUF3304 domain-containing protein [Janthinobacterium sp. YR213]SDI06770.1 Protein of unknown function [Janthinobacterium sp. YR213]
MIKKLLPKNLLNVFLCIFMAFSNAACGKEKMMLPVNVSGYNHTEHGIGGYLVTLSTGSEVEVGYLDAGAGGGGYTCCLSIPAVWKPGMTATIRMSTIKNGKEISVEKTVPVPKYVSSDAGRFIVHFLHNGNYKVFVTKYALGHRKYPLSGKEAELEPGVPLEIIWE